MEKFKQLLRTFKGFPKKIQVTLIIMSTVLLILVITLMILLFTKNQNEVVLPNDDNGQIQEEEPPEQEDPDQEQTTILDIPSLTSKDAFEILDILVKEYGEPNPKGLIAVLEELRDEQEPSFQTVTWIDIKYGYNFTFNFWTDGSLAREDSYYIIGYKRSNHSINEILKLTNLKQDDKNFVFNITDLGGATASIGITPLEAAQKPRPDDTEPEEELTKEEILELLKENADKKWKDDPARAKLEYDNQVEALNWVEEQTEYPDLMEKAKKTWSHDYMMVKWEYEKEVKAYESTLR